MKARLAVVAAIGVALLGMLATPAAAEVVTVGANLNSPPGFAGEGTCAHDDPLARPCVIVPIKISGSQVASPCDGTVIRFRLNGNVKPNNSYSIRVLRKNSAGNDYTSLAKSAAVQIQQAGINEYATSLPIAAGNYIGIDFEGSSEEFGLRWVFAAGLYEQLVFLPFDSGGTDATPDVIEQSHYLFNADVECKGSGGPPQGGTGTAPSNAFTIGKVVGKSVLVDVASAGQIQVAAASKPGKAKASAAAKGKKGKPKLLEPSSAHGGPGEVEVPLKLTKAAKAILKEKGKVKVKAKVVFTPVGGAAASQTKKLTIKAKPAGKGKAGK